MNDNHKILILELRRLAYEARLQSRSRHPALALQRLGLALQSLAVSLEGGSVDKSPFTPREQEILGHAANGFTNREIARALDLSEKTVEFHLASVFAKTDTSSRTEAVAFSLRAGWLSPT